MIIVDETLPEGDLPPPFPTKNVEVKFDVDMRDSYDLKKEIGRGRFGTVYLCTCKKSGLKFAAKFVNTKRNQDRENVEREIEIMKTLNDNEAHPKLIQLYDAYDMGKEMCLVLEVVNGGELFERVIDDDFELTERACAIFIKQICEGIEFIHSKNILHLDMKPENILCLSREGNRIKICDFGLARKYDPRKKLQVLFGTPEFVAPEVVNFEPISFGTDMWSIGVICYVLLSGLSPFMGHNYVETMTNVTHNKYDFEDDAFDDVSEDVKDFIERLLLLDKSERLTPAQCYRHRWLRSLETPQSIPGFSNLKSSALNDDTESDLRSPDTETETEDLSSSMDVVLDAKLDIMLTHKPDIKKDNINENVPVNDEEKKEVIIINVKEEGANKIEDKINENNNKDISESINLNDQAKKRSNSEANIENNNNESPSNDSNPPEEKRKKLRDFDKHELERTKSNLREFVERWNSHPNSPYMIGSPKLPAVICKLADGIFSRESFSSIDCAPPSNPDILTLEDIDPDSFHSHLTDVPPKAPLSSDKIALELGQRLESLQNEQKELEISNQVKDSAIKIEPLKHPDLLALQREAAGVSSTSNVPKDIAKKTEKEISGGKHRPSRDVINQPDKKYDTVTSPDQSPILTPGKRSRKTSKERDDRPSSRDSNRSTPAITRRRPSRDVPLTLTQVDRLNNLSDSHLDRKSTLDLWPDMICLSKDESDSTDSEGDYKPITGKLELGMKIPSSGQKDSTCSKSLEDKQSYFKKAKSCDEQSESKTITWVLDLENAKTPFITHGEKLRKADKNTTAENTERKQSLDESKPLLKPTSSSDALGQGLSKSQSSTSLASCNSFDNLTIQTPWGPMRRSPSKTSLKGDEAPIINISECFINITKSKNEGQSCFKSAPSIELKLSSTPFENNKTCSDKIKLISDKSKKMDVPEGKAKPDSDVKSELNSHNHFKNERHSYDLTSSGSLGKYSANLPNNIKTHKTFSDIQNETRNEKASQNQTIKVKKKEIESNSTNNTVDDTKSNSNCTNERIIISSTTKTDPLRARSSNHDFESTINDTEKTKSISHTYIKGFGKNTYSSNENEDKLNYTNLGKSKEIFIPIKMEPNDYKKVEKPALNESPKLSKKTIEIVIPIKREYSSKENLKSENTSNLSNRQDPPKEVAIPLERSVRTRASSGTEKPITIHILSDENNTYPPVTRKRSVDHITKKHLSSEKIDSSRVANNSSSLETDSPQRIRTRDLPEISKLSKSLQTSDSQKKTQCSVEQRIEVKKNNNSIQDSTSTSTISRRSSGISGISSSSDSGNESRTSSSPISSYTMSRRSSGVSGISNNSDISNESRILSKSPSRSPNQTIDIKKESVGVKCLLNKEDGLDLKEAKDNTNQLINIRSRNLSKSPSRSSKLNLKIDSINNSAEISGSLKKEEELNLTNKAVNENTNQMIVNITCRNLSKSPSRSSKLEQISNTKKDSSEKSISLREKNELGKSNNETETQIVTIRKRVVGNNNIERKIDSEVISKNKNDNGTISTSSDLLKSNTNLINISNGINKNILKDSNSEQKPMRGISSAKSQDDSLDIQLNLPNNKPNSENSKTFLNTNSLSRERRSKSPLFNSVSMIAIPTSKYEAERLQSLSLGKPQPAHHKSDNIQTEKEHNRHSFIENEEYSTNSLRRKSSKGNLPSSTKKSVGAMLFSAQDRISQFEKKKDDAIEDITLKPVLRSRTGIFLSDNQSKIKPTFNRSSLCENTKSVPSVVCSKSKFSTIAFATSRLLNKA